MAELVPLPIADPLGDLPPREPEQLGGDLYVRHFIFGDHPVVAAMVAASGLFQKLSFEDR